MNFKDINQRYPSIRKMRGKQHLRDMISESELSVSDLCHPVFIRNDISTATEVNNMPGIFYYPVQEAIDEIKKVQDMGVKHFVIRPRPTDAVVDNVDQSVTFEAEVIDQVARACPDVTKIIDGYFGMARTSGFYGAVNGNGNVELEKSQEEITKHAVAQAAAGADMIVTLGRVDNAVACVRNGLDGKGFGETAILSYCINFASTLAHAMLDGTDMAFNAQKQTIESKIGVGNIREALRQADIDVAQGADVLGVKPATIFMDAITQLRKRHDLPIATYIVSKEYCMVKAAAQNAWINEKDTVMEYMLSMKRAGANRIFNYWVKDIVKWIEE